MNEVTSNNDSVEHQQGASGRCIYCDERCHANTRYHYYCQAEYERENRYGLKRDHTKQRSLPPGDNY